MSIVRRFLNWLSGKSSVTPTIEPASTDVVTPAPTDSTIPITEWISVGEVSAERDQNLRHYFYDAGVSRDLVSNPKKYLLLGRKGAGKTAVFSHLSETPESIFGTHDVVTALSLQSYNWKAHNLLGDDKKAGGFQHRDSWRFVLCLETLRASKQLYAKSGVKMPKEIARAIETVEKIFSCPIPSWPELLTKKLFRISKVTVPKAGAGAEGFEFGGGEVAFEDLATDKTLAAALNSNLAALTDWLEQAIAHLDKRFRVFLLFDRLDEAWVADFVEQSKAIICGLIHASEYFLTKFNGRIRPLVFLRDDIFSTLDINDRNKLRQDCSSSLQWTEEGIEALVVTRVNYYAERAKQPAITSLQDIFVEQKMRSKVTPARYAFNRTMCRPRDMVALLSQVIEVAKADPELVVENKILSRAIYEAEAGYSDYLYEELSDEWRSQTPEFATYLQAIENIRYAVFTPAELENALSKKLQVSDHSHLRAISRFLFDNSIIGIIIGNAKVYRYKCFFVNQAFLDSKVFKIHPGLIKHLGLTERTSPNAPGGGDPNEVLAE